MRLIHLSILLVLAGGFGCASSQKPATPTAVTGVTASPDRVVVASTESTAAQVGSAVEAELPVVAAPPSDPIAARIGDDIVIYREQVVAPLLEAHGLLALQNRAILELARRDAVNAGLSISESDVDAERTLTIDRLFAETNVKEQEKIDDAVAAGDTATADTLRAALREDNLNALDQVLQNQRISRPDFDLMIQTNACLRAVARTRAPQMVTDTAVQEAFRAQYGERIKVRHIQVPSLLEVTTVQRRLAAGDPFETVASEMSRNPATRGLGGELPAFSRADTSFPQAFRDAAFDLEIKQVSDPVKIGNDYHVIRLDQRIDPTAVKFEDVRESVAADLQRRLIQQMVNQRRQELAVGLVDTLVVEDPVLRGQYDQQAALREQKARERQEMLDQVQQERERQALEQNASEPNTADQPDLAPVDAAEPDLQSQPIPAAQTQPADDATPADRVAPAATATEPASSPGVTPADTQPAGQ